MRWRLDMDCFSFSTVVLVNGNFIAEARLVNGRKIRFSPFSSQAVSDVTAIAIDCAIETTIQKGKFYAD